MSNMKRLPLLLCVLGLAVGALPADARPPREQDAAFEARQQGKILPLRVIKQRITQQMGDAEYLGSEFYSESGVYRLKFMREGRVIFVDVDGRSGRVVNRSGG